MITNRGGEGVWQRWFRRGVDCGVDVGCVHGWGVDVRGCVHGGREDKVKGVVDGGLKM